MYQAISMQRYGLAHARIVCGQSMQCLLPLHPPHPTLFPSSPASLPGSFLELSCNVCAVCLIPS